MKNPQRISRRVLRHFLHLAAASFAIGTNMAQADAADDETEPAATHAGPSRPATRPGTPAAHEHYRHIIPIPVTHEALPAIGPVARLRALDVTGRPQLLLALDGPASVGPLPPGAYTVLLKAGGMTEIHRVRIGPDTAPWLDIGAIT